jgi:hypothetical protein
MRCVGLALLVSAIASFTARADEGQPIFNGKDLQDWVAEGAREVKGKDGKLAPVWTVRDGMLHCQGQGFGFLRFARQQYGDFVFHVEYRMLNPKCNSGIGIRTQAFDPKQSRATRPSIFSYEIQIFDDHGKPPDTHSTGSLYRYVAPRVSAAKPVGEWNVADIECVGPHIRVTLNHQKLIDVDQSTISAIKDKPLRGYVCLQNHGGTLDFRNIRIREIKPGAGD